MGISALRHRDWVLLPGTLCTAAVFDGFLDVLDVPVHRRRSIDLCHGTVEAYQDAVTAQAEGAVVCGFSLGAIVAAHFADRSPAFCTILFGLNPFADDPVKSAARHDLARDVAALGGRAALASRLPTLRGLRPDTSREAILAMAKSSGTEIDAQTDLALSRPGAMTALSQARSPLLVLTGSQDQMAPPALGQAAAQAAPVGLFQLLPDLGHYALVEDPTACARAVTEMGDQARL